MRVPSTINKNCLKAYEPYKPYIEKICKNRHLQSYNFEGWDGKIPKTLQETCVECIAKNWLGSKSGKSSASGSKKPSRKHSTLSNERPQGRTWKKVYCEMHVTDYLENLCPEYYNPEKIKELCDLFGPYVELLVIDEMIPSETSANKIPLNAVITGFPHLTELSLRFKQSYAKGDFSWYIVTTSMHDIQSLCKGLERIRLKILRITNSDIDCEKALIILKALLKHDLQVLDFSHCKIGNRGAVALAKFVMENTIMDLHLGNNRIGSRGIECLAYAMSQTTCNLKILDVHLNQFSNESGNILMNSLGESSVTKCLYLSACGLSGEFQIAEALKRNSLLEVLDISNNRLGEETGIKLLDSLRFNTTLKKLDIRMCKISSSREADIQEEIYKNTKGVVKPERVEELISFKFNWDENLVTEVEEVFAEEYVEECFTPEDLKGED